MGALGNLQVDARPALAVSLRYGLAVASVATALGTTLILRYYGSPPGSSPLYVDRNRHHFLVRRNGSGSARSLALFFGSEPVGEEPFLLFGFPLESFLIFHAVFSMLMSWFSASRRRAEQLLTEARDNLDSVLQSEPMNLYEPMPSWRNSKPPCAAGKRTWRKLKAQSDGQFRLEALQRRDSLVRGNLSDLPIRPNHETDRGTCSSTGSSEDVARVQETIARASQDGKDFDRDIAW